jgi:hypothetical protein
VSNDTWQHTHARLHVTKLFDRSGANRNRTLARFIELVVSFPYLVCIEPHIPQEEYFIRHLPFCHLIGLNDPVKGIKYLISSNVRLSISHHQIQSPVASKDDTETQSWIEGQVTIFSGSDGRIEQGFQRILPVFPMEKGKEETVGS